MLRIAPSSACSAAWRERSNCVCTAIALAARWIIACLQQLVGKNDLRPALRFRQQPRLGRLGDKPLTARHLVLRTGHRRVETNEDLAALHFIPILDQDRFDLARTEVLHRLAVAGHDDLATGRDPLVERRQSGPQHETAESRWREPASRNATPDHDRYRPQPPAARRPLHPARPRQHR
jgi:hypothetical protein